jgi:osmoprotectant transport system permease protein
MENFYEQLALLPANLANHLKITVIPLLIGIALSLPLAILAVNRPRIRYPLQTAVGIIQTIPSLALLALMFPIFSGLSALLTWAVGLEIAALGFPPTVTALTLYSLLPMLRNAVTGILEVDPAMVEAAQGMGMTPRQVLWRVQLPLAAPVIIAGIRTATVWVVGIATLATPVGQRCLGNYIFRGLQTRNWTSVLFGCVAAALLAVVLDLLIGSIEKALRERKRWLAVVSCAVLVCLLAGGMVAPAAVRRLQGEGASSGGVVMLGTKTFTEQYILAALIEDVLDDASFDARTRESLGSTVVFDALAAGEIDAYVDYSGTIWANYMQRTETADAETVLDAMTRWLEREHGIRCLGSLGFENAYGLAMRRDRAEKLGITTIADLAPHAPGMKIGGDYEFFGRPEWRQIRERYGLAFSDQISYDSTFMYRAVEGGTVDVISAFTSDGRITAYDLVILDDPENAIPPYDAVLLLAGAAAERPGLTEALRPLIGAIPVGVMRRANYMVDRDENKKTVTEAARWLRTQIAGGDS